MVPRLNSSRALPIGPCVSVPCGGGGAPETRMTRAALPSLLLLAGLLASPLALPCAAQVPLVESVSPASGGLGTELVISGSGFAGRGTPKALLDFGDEADSKFRLRVTSVSDVEIRAEVVQAKLGLAAVSVKLPKGPAVELADAFEVLPPLVTGVAPLEAVPGDVVTLTGSDFGPRRIKVLLFDRPCKITASAAGSVSFRVPPSLPDGEWTPRLQNPLAEAVAPLALLTAGSDAPPPVEAVQARVDGAPFVAGEADVLAANLGSKLAFDATAVLDDVQQQLSVLLPFAPVFGKVPALFSGTGFGSEPVFLQQVLLSDAPPQVAVYVAVPAALPWKAQVLGRSQGRLFGQFEAVLQRISGAGPDQLVLEDGWFVVAP